MGCFLFSVEHVGTGQRQRAINCDPHTRIQAFKGFIFIFFGFVNVFSCGHWEEEYEEDEDEEEEMLSLSMWRWMMMSMTIMTFS